KRAIEGLRPGDVLVMEARGELGTGTIGDILALRAQVRGAAAVVTDGGLRDSAVVAALDLPVFHAGAHPAVLGRRHVPWEIDVPDPVSNKTYATAAAGDAADVDRAVVAARRAFVEGAWPTMGARARARVLCAIAEGIEAREERLAELESFDTGLPITQARG